MARPIDASIAMKKIREYMENFPNANTRLATCRAILSMLGDENQIPVLAPSSDPLTPCDLCRYNPPSSFDGKPCCACPAEKGPIERIKNAPTVDAVPVVRCKDCIHWRPDGVYRDGLDGDRRMYGKCTRMCSYYKDDDFCSYGGEER